MSEKRKYLITGASGLIGGAVLNLLEADNDAEVYAIGRHNAGSCRKNIKDYFCDFSKDWDTKNFPSNIDVAIHFAQSERYREFPDYAEEIFQINTLSTVKLFEYARKANVKTFVYASSGGIYGHGDDEFYEDSPVIAKEGYGFYLGTKFCSEIIAENYVPYMNVVILRFFFVYGPGQKPGMLIPRIVQFVKDGKPILLHGDDGIKINPIYVTDAAKAVQKAFMLRESQKINIAGPEVLSLRKMGDIIGKIVGKEPKFDVREVKANSIIGNTEKMNKLLCKPEIKFKEGIAKYLKTTRKISYSGI